MDAYGGLYYGNHFTTEMTFKKSLLLHDELHIFDRPSFNIQNGIGTIGQNCWLRKLPEELRRDDFRVVCHEPVNGPIEGAMREAINSDLADEQFMQTFMREFFGPGDFAWHFLIKDGNYALKVPTEKRGKKAMNGVEIRSLMAEQDWSDTEFSIERVEAFHPSEVLESGYPLGLNLQLNWYACKASHTLNTFLLNTLDTNAVPFTDISGYHELLAAKYGRCVNSDEFTIPHGTKISYIAETILDDLLVSDTLSHRTIGDVLIFREKNAGLLQDFRHYLRELQYKVENEPFTPEFERELQRLLNLEVLPKATEYKRSLRESWESLFGSLVVRGTAGAVGMTAAILKEVPFDRLITVGTAAGLAGWLTASVVSFLEERRNHIRRNGLAYLLKL